MDKESKEEYEILNIKQFNVPLIFTFPHILSYQKLTDERLYIFFQICTFAYSADQENITIKRMIPGKSSFASLTIVATSNSSLL